MNLYLVRHGQTEWNNTGKWQGKTDIPLDKTGILQAEKLAERMKNFKGIIYTSDLLRAKKTAEIISSQNSSKIIETKELREINFGSWEGKTYDEIKTDPLFSEWDKNCELSPHGGESHNEAYNRIVNFVKSVVKCEDNDIIIVSHGGVLMLLTCYILNMSTNDRSRISFGNTSLSKVYYNKDLDSFRLIMLNDIAHINYLIGE